MNFKKTLFCTLVGFLIAPLVNGASYIGDEEYPWYMHEEIGDGSASMLILDNSPYMASEVLYNNETGYEYTKLHDVEKIDYSSPNPHNLTCAGYNLLAYNPELIYVPWAGVDVSGASFKDYRTGSYPYTSVRKDPYLPDNVDPDNTKWFSSLHKWSISGGIHGINQEDLTTHVFYKWTGSMNYQFIKYDEDECSGVATSFNDLTEEEKGNYANWFVYYRTRRHVSRAIASNVIAKVDGPLGMNTVGIAYNEQIWGPLVDLRGVSENDGRRINMIHNAMALTAEDVGHPETNGHHVSALAATFQYMQHGSQAINIVQASAFNPMSMELTYSVRKDERPMETIFDGNVCNIGRMIMISPSGFVGDGGNNRLQAWGIPCEPMLGIGNTPIPRADHCVGGLAGIGDADSGYGRRDSDYDQGFYSGPPFSSDLSAHTLADITMHYYEMDMSKHTLGEGNPKVREKESDPHFITDMAGFGVSTPKIEAGYSAITTNYWNDPYSGGVVDRLDDVFHAAYNGRGIFISPRFPAELVGLIAGQASQVNAVGEWGQRYASTAGRVAKVEAAVISDTIVPSSLIPTLSDHWFFAGEYMTGTWSGDLKAYHYSQTQNKYGKFSTSSTNFSKGNVADGHVWSAEEKLKADLTNDDVIEWGNRKVFTLGNAGSGVLFSTDLNSSDKSKMINEKMVDTNDSGSADGGDVDDLINYIKGDSSNESYEMLRPRSSLIGDIINSNPTYVDGSTPMVYVGSNDGMLHGFDAKTGSEIFAYVPATLFPELYKLGLTEDFKHKMMVDGPVSVYDVGSKKMLFSGLGHGGKGYFALNVTNPKASASSIVEWEINSDNSEYSDMGYTFATLKVIEVGGQKYGLIANGYDSDNGNAVLYLVDLADGSKVGAVSISGGGGLSTPAVVVKSSSEVYAYAGAMDGNVYKFKVSLTASGAILNGSSSPFYDGSSDQPITVEPAIVRNHPATGEQGVLIAFGTGRYLTKEDHNDGSENAKNQIGENIPAPKTQAIYVIGDHDVSDMTSGNFGSSSLLQRTYSEVSSGDNEYRISDYPLEEGKANFALWGKDNWFDGNDGTMRGWYIELSHAERVISKPYIFAHKTTEFKIEDSDDNDNQTNYQAGIVVFSTLIPGCNECDNATSGWLMALRAYDGKANYMSFDTTDDHVLNDSNSDAEKKGGSATTGYCGIKQDDGQFAVSGFTMVKRLNDTYEAKFREDDNKPNGDNFGTVDLVGVAAGKTKIYNVTIRNNDIGDKPDENPPAPRRISWKELRRNH